MQKDEHAFREMFDIIINQGNTEACGDFFTQDVVIHDNKIIISGLHELKKVIEERSANIPDYECTVDDVIIGHDDKVVVRWQAHGMPIQDTGVFKAGEPINYYGMTLFEMENGKASKVWQYGTGVDIQ